MKTFILKLILMLPIPLEPQHVELFLYSHGIKAKVEIVRLADPLTLGTQSSYFSSLRKAFTRKRNEHVHILTDPFLDTEGIEWMMGYAAKTDKISFSVWNSQNTSGEQRGTHSWVALLHELGHQLGLGHSLGCTSVMDGAAMACPNVEALTFTEQEKNSIKKFLK